MRTREKERAARHIVATFNKATTQEVIEGMDWYVRARALAEELDPQNAERAAAVIAVLSPRLNWSKNVEVARLAYRLAHQVSVSLYPEWRLPVLNANADKARRLLIDGEDPNEVVQGPKVRAFWHAIVRPEDPRAVVIDRHALDVAFGKVMDDRTRGALLGKKGAYDEIAERYAFAAEVIGNAVFSDVKPPQVQAVTWVVWRRLKKEGAV